MASWLKSFEMAPHLKQNRLFDVLRSADISAFVGTIYLIRYAKTSLIAHEITPGSLTGSRVQEGPQAGRMATPSVYRP